MVGLRSFDRRIIKYGIFNLFTLCEIIGYFQQAPYPQLPSAHSKHDNDTTDKISLTSGTPPIFLKQTYLRDFASA
jgi:hypothetical protein